MLQTTAEDGGSAGGPTSRESVVRRCSIGPIVLQRNPPACRLIELNLPESNRSPEPIIDSLQPSTDSSCRIGEANHIYT